MQTSAAWDFHGASTRGVVATKLGLDVDDAASIGIADSEQVNTDFFDKQRMLEARLCFWKASQGTKEEPADEEDQVMGSADRNDEVGTDGVQEVTEQEEDDADMEADMSAEAGTADVAEEHQEEIDADADEALNEAPSLQQPQPPLSAPGPVDWNRGIMEANFPHLRAYCGDYVWDPRQLEWIQQFEEVESAGLAFWLQCYEDRTAEQERRRLSGAVDEFGAARKCVGSKFEPADAPSVGRPLGGLSGGSGAASSGGPPIAAKQAQKDAAPGTGSASGHDKPSKSKQPTSAALGTGGAPAGNRFTKPKERGDASRTALGSGSSTDQPGTGGKDKTYDLAV